ncbi:Uracil DNA glycosylase superfamily protein [Fodinibius salinus]|uniref:Uracil DNA glycosylase superfamily protein n=1 Tax=Fodinibius salinus TaxID=860790 RepID=A0A5D3YFN1_9BACT|nr:uracil-DNA glycosylase [Fodinibius salinus]TYP91931.1 Uracil DNA glycosylase superfamily protein [Fodinibius salinus]
MDQLESLFKELKKTPEGAFFNPWFQEDAAHDQPEDAPNIRRRQLRTYLSERMGKAKYLFIAEALGYQGGHFTGIAMTSERILLGHHKSVHGIPADGAFTSIKPKRTSKPAVNKKGMSEPTATIMWKAIYQLGIDPYECVLWNALPWHPYDADEGLLSNRTPTNTELEKGYPALRAFLELYPDASIIAVGRKCEQSLDAFDISNYVPVRHPAHGGAPKFRRQMKKLIEN